MIYLTIAIIISLLVTLVLPIAAGIWVNKHLNISWRVITLGALGYLISQVLLTFLYSGYTSLTGVDPQALAEGAAFTLQVIVSILIASLLGVILRWAGMRFIKMPLVNLEAAYGIGLGYGGIESILQVGFPLLMTFLTMLQYTNPQASGLDPLVIDQLETLWQVSPWVPIAGSLERIEALVMHITVTILILQAFTRKNPLWLGAAVGLEVLINGLIFRLAELGIPYGWVVMIAAVLMAGNLYLLYRLKAFKVTLNKAESEISN